MIYFLFSLGEVLEKGFIGIILTLDTLIYGLISSAFKVFMAIASARLLSSDAYYTIANKVYLIIGVLMLFVLSYSMLKAIVNPDEGKKSFGPGLIKRIVIAVVGLAIAPALFNLMYQVQGLVLEHNVLGRLFFRSDNTAEVSPGTIDVGGQQVTLDDVNPDDYINVVGGSVTATTIWQAFFYPAEDSGKTSDDIVGNLGDYYLTTGTYYGIACAIGTGLGLGYVFGPVGWAAGLLGTAVAAFTCGGAVKNIATGIATNEEITLSQAYVSTAQGDPFGVYTVFINNYVEDGEISYLYGISTITGAFALYAFITFSIDMGVRAAKLAYYQIIAPVPLIMQVLPGKGESTFKTYWHDVLHTFLEVFIRIAVVYIVVYIVCHLQDLFSSVDALWGNQELSTPEVMLAMAFLIIGLIIFCKDAPKFLGKSLGIESGNLDLGIRNKLAKGGAYTAASAVGGGVTAGVNNMTNKWKQMKDAKGFGEKSKLFFQGFTSGAAGAVSGAVRGGIAGKDAKTLRDVQRGATTGALGAKRARENREAYADIYNDGLIMGENSVLNGRVRDVGRAIKRWAGFDDLESLQQQAKSIQEIKSAHSKFEDAAKALIAADAAKGKKFTYGIPATRTLADGTVKDVGFFMSDLTSYSTGRGSTMHTDAAVRSVFRPDGKYDLDTIRKLREKISIAEAKGDADGYSKDLWEGLYQTYLKGYAAEVMSSASLTDEHWDAMKRTDLGLHDSLVSLRSDAVELRRVLTTHAGNEVISNANDRARTDNGAQFLTVDVIRGEDLVFSNNSALDKIGAATKEVGASNAAKIAAVNAKEKPEGGGGKK